MRREAEAHRQEQARLAAETQSAPEQEAQRLDALRTETASAQQRLQTTRQDETSARDALDQVRAALDADVRIDLSAVDGGSIVLQNFDLAHLDVDDFLL